MKFFIDTRFTENGPSFSLVLLSLGIVCEDSREFYAVNADALLEPSDWVKHNVLSHLGPNIGSIRAFPKAILQFVGDSEPEILGLLRGL